MIVYIGNNLSIHGFAPSTMETIVPKLTVQHQVRSYSSKKVQVFRIFDMITAILKLRRKARIVFIDVYSTKAFWYFVIVARLCVFLKIPFVPIFHGGNLPKRVEKNSSLVNSIFYKAAVCLSPSFYLKHYFEKLGLKVILIPNFLEINNYTFKKRGQLLPKLLWVRSFHRIYNPQLAIHLVHELAKQYDNIELCMVGPDKDGSLEKTKNLARELGVEKKVRFTGKLSKKDWISLSADFDIFINTTDYDNMPVSVIEAMALGLPVVSTNVGGIPDLIDSEKDGLLVSKNDVEGFRSAIVKLLENPALGESLSTTARTKAESFSWEKVGPLWDEVIHTYQKKS